MMSHIRLAPGTRRRNDNGHGLSARKLAEAGAITIHTLHNHIALYFWLKLLEGAFHG